MQRGDVSSSSSGTRLSAADLIKRFREGQPTSAEERRSAMGDRSKMWWEDSLPRNSSAVRREDGALSDSYSRQNSPPLGTSRNNRLLEYEETSPLPRQRLVPPDELEADIDREMGVYKNLSRGDRDRSVSAERGRSLYASAGQQRSDDYFKETKGRDSISNDPFARRSQQQQSSRLLAFDADERHRERDAPFRSSRTFGRSLDIDSLFQNEIHKLTEEVRRREQDTTRRLQASIGGGNTLGNSQSSGIYGVAGGETLGSTGCLALHRADMRLDGLAAPPPKANDKSTGDDGKGTTDVKADALNKELEEILAELQKKAPPPEPVKTYLPAGIEETIPQIISQLTQDMEQTVGRFTAQYAMESDEAKKSQDELELEQKKWKQIGAEEERSRRFLDALESGVSKPVDLLTIWKAAPPSSSSVLTANAGKPSTGSEAAVDLSEDPRIRRARFAESVGLSSSSSPTTTASVSAVGTAPAAMVAGHAKDSTRVMQCIIDNELSSADEILRQMRSMRTHLGFRALQLQSMTLQSQQQQSNAGDVSFAPSAISAVSAATSNGFWGIEEHKDTLERLAEQERDRFTPYPALVHKNILSVAQAVDATLSSAMSLLEKRLPGTSAIESQSAPATADAAAASAALQRAVDIANPVKTSTPEKPVDKSMTDSSFDFDLSLSRPNSPMKEAPQVKKEVEKNVESNKSHAGNSQVNVHQALNAIDALLGADETRYLSPSKPLSAGRFDRFLSSRSAGEHHASSAALPEPQWQSAPAIDVLKDVRVERHVRFGGPSVSYIQQETPSAPPPPLQAPAFVPSAAAPISAPKYESSRDSYPGLWTQRPVEGSAMNYLKSQTVSFSQPASVTASIFNQQPQFSASATNSPPVHRLALNDREEYLLKMRAQRERLLSTMQ